MQGISLGLGQACQDGTLAQALLPTLQGLIEKNLQGTLKTFSQEINFLKEEKLGWQAQIQALKAQMGKAFQLHELRIKQVGQKLELLQKEMQNTHNGLRELDRKFFQEMSLSRETDRVEVAQGHDSILREINDLKQRLHLLEGLGRKVGN